MLDVEFFFSVVRQLLRLMLLTHVSAMLFSDYLLSMLVFHSPFRCCIFLVDLVIDAFLNDNFVVLQSVRDDLEVFDARVPNDFARDFVALHFDVPEGRSLTS